MNAKKPDESIRKLASQTDDLNSMTKKELNGLAKLMTWGTYGPKGDKPLKIKPLSKLSTSHIKNILITQYHITPKMRKVFMYIIDRRNNRK